MAGAKPNKNGRQHESNIIEYIKNPKPVKILLEQSIIDEENALADMIEIQIVLTRFTF